MSYKKEYENRFWLVNISESGRRTTEFYVIAESYEIKDGFVTFYNSNKKAVQSYQSKYVYSIRN